MSGVASSILTVEFSICSQGMGEDNSGDPAEEAMSPSTSLVRSSEELG